MPSNERIINPVEHLSGPLFSFLLRFFSTARHSSTLHSASLNDSNCARYKNLSFSDLDNKAVNVESEIWMAIS